MTPKEDMVVGVCEMTAAAATTTTTTTSTTSKDTTTPIKTLDESEGQPLSPLSPRGSSSRPTWVPLKVISVALFLLLVGVCVDLYLLSVSMTPKAVEIILSESGPDAYIGLEAEMPPASTFSSVTFDYFECKVYHQRNGVNDDLTQKKIVTTLTSSDHFTTSSHLTDILSTNRAKSRVKIDVDMTNNDFATIRAVLKDLYTKDPTSMSSMSCSFDLNAHILSFIPMKISDIERNYEFPYARLFPSSESNTEKGVHEESTDSGIIGSMKSMWNGEKMKAMANNLLETSPDNIRSFDIDCQLTLYEHLDDMDKFFIQVPSAKYRVGAQEEDKTIESWTVETTAFTVDLVNKDTSYLKSTVSLGCTDGEKSGCELSDPALAAVRQAESGHISYAVAPFSTASSKRNRYAVSSHDLIEAAESGTGNFLEELVGGNIEVDLDFNDYNPASNVPDASRLNDVSDVRNINIRLDFLGIIEHESLISLEYMMDRNGMELDLLIEPASGFSIGVYVALFNFRIGFEVYELQMFGESIISSSSLDEAFYAYALLPRGENPFTTDGKHPITFEATVLEWIHDDNSTNLAIINDYSGASTDGKKCGALSQNSVAGNVSYCFDGRLLEVTLRDSNNDVIVTFGGHFSGSLGPAISDFDFGMVVYVTPNYNIMIQNPFTGTEMYMPGALEISMHHVEAEVLQMRLRIDDIKGDEMLLIEGGTGWEDFYGLLNMGVRRSFLKVDVEQDQVFEWKLSKGEVRVLPDDDFLSLRAEGMKVSIDGDEVLGMSVGITLFMNGVNLLGRLSLERDEIFFGRFVAGWHVLSMYNFDLTVEKLLLRTYGEEIVEMDMTFEMEEYEDSEINHMNMAMTCDLSLFDEQLITVKRSDCDMVETSNYMNATGNLEGILGDNEKHFDAVFEISYNMDENSFDVMKMDTDTSELVITSSPSFAPTPYPHAVKTKLKFSSKLTFQTSKSEFETDEKAQKACIDAYKKVLGEPTAAVSVGKVEDVSSAAGSLTVAESRIKVEFITVLIKEKLTKDITDTAAFFEELSTTIETAVSKGEYGTFLEEAFLENDVVQTFESEKTVEVSELEVDVEENSSTQSGGKEKEEGLSVTLTIVIVVVCVVAVFMFCIGVFFTQNKNKIGPSSATNTVPV